MNFTTRLIGASEVPTVPVQTVHGRHVGKAAAVIAVSCAILHIPVIVVHLHAHPVIALLMLALTTVCLGCVTRLWYGPMLQDWGAISVLAVSMLVLHLSMGTSTNHSTAPPMMHSAAHHDGMEMLAESSMHVSGATQPLFYAATILAGAQALLGSALVVSAISARRRAPRTEGIPAI
jgi:hypothetical protein